jgi:thioredoxin-related protein
MIGLEAAADVESAGTRATSLKSHIDQATLAGQEAENKISELIAASAGVVLIFSKEGCPFCIEAKRTFFNLGVPHTVRRLR